MSASLLLALEARAADAATPPLPASLGLASSTVFRELSGCICAHASLETLAHVLLRLDTACRGAARSHLSVVLPKLRPLLAAPFALNEAELLDKDTWGLCDEEVDIAALAAACASGALASLNELLIDNDEHPALIATCQARGIML